MRYLIFLTFIFLVFNLFAQEKYTSTIKGKIIDKESKYPLPGVSVAIFKKDSLIKGTSTNNQGYYKLKNINVGRYQLRFTMVGYEPVYRNNILVNSGKETILNIKMQETTQNLKEVKITAEEDKTEPVNKMASVSARTFTTEETEKYAGSRQDPARMVQNYAGVQGTDDSRNDIVVRGNSPMGVLWRYENVNIPNPNHFAVAGSQGGPISVLNNKVFATSDFITGAFPSGYGNATSAVFDVNMRNGNSQNYEFTGQLGLFGTEALAEGPVSKDNRSSFLASYRYSTFKIFDIINFNLGTSATPIYQDASFKLNFPTDSLGTFSVFGIGGKSRINIIVNDWEEYKREFYGIKNRDQYFQTSMGMTGVSHEYPINKNTHYELTLAASGQRVFSHHDLVKRKGNTFKVDTIKPKLDYQMLTGKISSSFILNKKFGVRHTLKGGYYADRYGFNLTDSIFNNFNNKWKTRLNANSSAFLVQPFLSWKYRLNQNITLNTGIHAQHFTLNGSFSIEPRIGAEWHFRPDMALNAGFGMHSQMQPTYIYFHQVKRNEEFVQYNKDLGFTKSNHYIVGYDYSFAKNWRLKTEIYYQYLYNIPVEKQPSSYSILNQGSGFDRFFPKKLENKGTAFNYGLETTLEKFFGNNYFILFTGSLYESKYRGSDGILRNTDYNGNFATNFLIGTEQPLGKKKNTFLTAGANITWAGGRRYSPVNVEKSLKSEDVVWVDSLKNSRQFRNYFRVDIKAGLKVNTKNITHEFALDILNLLDRKNILTIRYDPDIQRADPNEDPLRKIPQLGRLPVFYYKIDF